MYYMSNLRKKGLEVVRHGHPRLVALAWIGYFREHAGVCGKIPLDVSTSVVASSFPLVLSGLALPLQVGVTSGGKQHPVKISQNVHP